MSILGIGISGLLAYQRAMATTSHNISNASTEGYSRQRVTFQAQTPQAFGGLSVGRGVGISAIDRLQNDLISRHLRDAMSDSFGAELRAAYAEGADALLADEATGLQPALDAFFNSIHDVADDPTSISSRTVMLNEAGSVVERFSQLNSRFEEQRDLVNGSIETAVEEINQYSQALADLNEQIVAKYAGGEAPNDVLDERDNILSKLSEKLDVSITEQDDGSISVFVGNGQSLVLGNSAKELVAGHLSGDPENLQIGFKTSPDGAPANVTRFMSGGELGALLETRTELLDTAQNEIGLLALNLATRFNEQHAQGEDLNGNPGGDLFTLPNVAVSAKQGNTTPDMPGVTISDVSSLTASDYRLGYDGTAYTLIRVPGNESVALTDLGGGVYEADGMQFDTSAMGASPSDGDSWLVQPTRFAAGGLGVAISDPDLIAAAGSGGGAGDNRNALAMADIQDLRTVGGSKTIQDSYNSLLADVGSQTRQAQIVRDSSTKLLESAQARRDAISGVNLDEEASNLMRFQQAYEASAQVITTAGDMFNALLGVFR